MAESVPKNNGQLALEGTTNDRQTIGAEVAAQGRKANRGSFGAPGRDPKEAAAKSAEVRTRTCDTSVAKEIDPGPVEQEEGMPDQLVDMRHVYSRPKKADRTAGQKACREWIEDNISSFMAAKSRLEEAFLEYKRDQAVPTLPEESAPDEPLERLIALVEEDLRTKPWLKKEEQ